MVMRRLFSPAMTIVEAEAEPFLKNRIFTTWSAPKGSVALDGVSLTVNEVEDTRFGVNIIPHTLRWTSFRGALPETDGPAFGPGRRVNFEIDMLARYLQRLVETR